MISLIHPSRGRPQQAYSRVQDWINKAGKPVEHIISIDINDPLRDEYLKYNWQHIIVNDNGSVVEATNKAAKLATGDILIYLSDDFECPDNWAELVEKEFESRPMLLKVDDCLQPLGTMVLTIPIMNRLLYERLGYFWHPGYKSMFVDEDLFWTCRKMGALKYAEHLKFPHIHPANGKAPNDETYQRSALNWDSGKATFQRRKQEGFL
jgi:glycosyltransferase involved in cell wall biosynthesis